MSEPFIGQTMIFAGNFAPRGWASCNGQLQSIAQNDVLYTLIGTTYGGDGVNTFALPDMRGRLAVHQGTGPGLSNYTMGETGGQETHTLITNEMPAHTHSVAASTLAGDQATLNNNYLAESSAGVNIYTNAVPNAALNMHSLMPVGSNQPHENMQPFLALNFCIALEGIWPSQS